MNAPFPTVGVSLLRGADRVGHRAEAPLHLDSERVPRAGGIAVTALPNALRAWGSAAFASRLKTELEALAPSALPLGAAATPGCHVDDSPLTVSVLRVTEDAHRIQARVGVFFCEIVVNCGCGDEPFLQNAYCELRVAIDKATAETVFTVIPQ